MKEKLLEYINKETKTLKEVQYKRNQAQAFIIEGEILALENLRKRIDKL